MTFKIKKLTSKIIHINYPSQEEMNKACIRVNTYIENPKYKGKIFTLGQVREYYTEKQGFFSYYKRVYGTNLSREALEPFIKGTFDPLSKEELELIEPFRYRMDNFFLLVTFEENSMENKATFMHELAHGLFYTDKEYKNQSIKIINRYRKDLKPIFAYLKKTGYHKDTWIDEAQAFVSADYDWLKLKKVYVPVDISLELQKLVKEKMKGSISYRK